MKQVQTVELPCGHFRVPVTERKSKLDEPRQHKCRVCCVTFKLDARTSKFLAKSA